MQANRTQRPRDALLSGHAGRQLVRRRSHQHCHGITSNQPTDKHSGLFTQNSILYVFYGKVKLHLNIFCDFHIQAIYLKEKLNMVQTDTKHVESFIETSK